MEKGSNKNFYNRLNVLAGTKSPNKLNEDNNLGTLVDSLKANDGSTFGIIKEQHHYYIKKTNTQDAQLHESDFAYIGGVENKLDYEYGSLHEAQKQRNFILKSFNEAFSTKPKTEKAGQVINEDVTNNDGKINPFNLIKSRIQGNKKDISEGREEKFKNSLNAPTASPTKYKGLLPEAADLAIKKALGLIKEEVLTTADSEVKDGDILADKTGKEAPQAPINDSNAKSKADSATATDSMPGKPSQPNSLSVNEEALATADSEINSTDVLADKTDKKETPQAPVNDSNAKSEADKANANDSMPGKPSQPNSLSVNEDVLTTADSEIDANTSLTNQVNAGKETPQAPINDSNAKAEADKNDTGEGSMDEPQKVSGAIVTETKDISTQDSDVKGADMIANEKGHEKPEAPYNSYNQPNKAHTDGMKKGEDLKPKESKKDVVAESQALATADSEVKSGDVLADKKDKKEAPQAPVNDANAKSKADSATATDSMPGKPSQPNSLSVNEDINDGETELDAAADALNSLTAAPAEAPVAPAPAAPEEAPVDEPAADDGIGDIDLSADTGGDVPADVPADDAGGDDGEITDDLVDSEIEKLTGKLTDKLRKNDNTDAQIKSVLNSVISAVAADLGDVDVEERKEISDKIIKAQGGSEEGAVDDGLPAEETPAAPAPEEGGEEAAHISGLETDAEDAIDQKIATLDDGGGETAPVEDEPIKEDDIDLTDAASQGEDQECVECGTFESYMGSRGYTNENMDDCSAMEMGNLVSGYANAYADGNNDGDFQNVAKFITPEIESELQDYGQTEYLEQLKPHMGENEDGQKLSFGSIEPSVNPLDDLGGLGETDEEPGDESSEETPAKETPAVPDDGIETIELDPNRSKPDIGFVGGSEVMGAGVNKPDGAKTKSVDVDLQTGHVNVTMTEGESKVRKYIQARIEEKATNKKPLLSEDKKTENMKKLDKIIDSRFSEFVESFNKK